MKDWAQKNDTPKSKFVIKIFLARATEGTSLYVWVSQLVSQSVSQLVS